MIFSRSHTCHSDRTTQLHRVTFRPDGVQGVSVLLADELYIGGDGDVDRAASLGARLLIEAEEWMEYASEA